VQPQEMMCVNLKLNPEFRWSNMQFLLSLRQWKFMSAFRALSHSTLYRRWTSRTSKCPAVCYVKGETTFRTFHNMFSFRTHSSSLSLKQPLTKILKTFLEITRCSNAVILPILQKIKYRDQLHMKNCLERTN